MNEYLDNWQYLRDYLDKNDRFNSPAQKDRVIKWTRKSYPEGIPLKRDPDLKTTHLLSENDLKTFVTILFVLDTENNECWMDEATCCMEFEKP